jgi:V/A-type H+-transporting ATPase subunit A
VSPAGGNFEEPVTQGTLKVVGAFHGLSRDRAESRRYPAIHPLESWSKYPITVQPEKVQFARNVLMRGDEVDQMMKVVGEEGTSIDDYVVYLKSELLDAVYLQQDSFNAVDAAVSLERQNHDFSLLCEVLDADLKFKGKDDARSWFYQLRQKFLDHNVAEWQSDGFNSIESELRAMVQDRLRQPEAAAEQTASE